MISVLTLHAADPLMNDPFGDEIFKEMYEMQKEMDKVFERMHQRMQQRTLQLNQPDIQFYTPSSLTSENMFVDKGDHYEYDTGIKADQNNEINLSVKDGILTFRARVTETTSKKEQGIHSQRNYTSVVQRSQTLPEDADPNSVKMEEKEGIITVMIEKKKASAKPMKTPSDSKRLLPVPSNNTKEQNRTIKKVPHTATEA
jgi:HSP20 family molecular chaperone IbpA